MPNGLDLVRAAFRKFGIKERQFARGELFAEGVVGCIFTRRPVCFVASWLSDAQVAAVLAHELGHFVLHAHDPVQAPFYESGNSGKGLRGGYSPEELKERQAEVFAGEFLCPAGWLRGELAAGRRPSAIALNLNIPIEIVMEQAISALVVAHEPPPAGRSSLGTRRDLGRDLDAAVSWDRGHLIVEGGPGTGKTSALAQRVGWLVDNDVPISSIVVITSEQGVDVVRRNLDRRLACDLRIGTPRTIGLDLVRRWPEPLGRAFSPKILDRVGAIDLLSAIVEEVTGATDRKRTTLVWNAIAAHANTSGRWAVHEEGTHDAANTFQEILTKYETALRRANAFDPNGLLPAALHLMQTLPELQSECRKRFIEVLVDDAEDLSPASIELLMRLVSFGARLWIAGCKSISTQRFAGAAPDALSQIAKRLVADHIDLSTNLEVRTSIPPGRGWSRSQTYVASRHTPMNRPTIAISSVPTIEAEADAIARNVEAAKRDGIDHRDQVIVARSHNLLGRLAGHLKDRGVPLAYFGDLGKRREVGDLLRALAHANAGRVNADNAGASQTLRDWLFERSDYLAPLIVENAGLDGQVAMIVIHHVLSICSEHDAADDAKIENLAERIRVAGALGQETAYRKATLDSSEFDAVRVMTIHACKGLSFGAVHVAGLSEGYMPARVRRHQIPWPWIPEFDQSDHDANEEALFLVATSRATSYLFLSRAKTYARLGTQPSRLFAILRDLASKDQLAACAGNGRISSTAPR